MLGRHIYEDVMKNITVALIDLPLWHRAVGFCVDGVSYVLLLWGFWLFIKLLGQYQFFVGLLMVVASLVYEGYKLKSEQDLTV